MYESTECQYSQKVVFSFSWCCCWRDFELVYFFVRIGVSCRAPSARAPVRADGKKGRRGLPATPLRPTASPSLPEEVVDHVGHLAVVDVHQQRIVIVAHPAIGAIGRRQAILPRIVQPVVRAEIARPQVVADRKAAVAIAIWVIVAAQPVKRAVAAAIAIPS